jgi:integrase
MYPQHGGNEATMVFYASNNSAPHRTLPDHEQHQLLAITGERRDGYRDHVLYSMALATGLREHELAGLEISDVFEPDGKARKRIVLRVFKRSSDTPAQQDVIVPEGLRAKLEKFWGGGRPGSARTSHQAPRCSPATAVNAFPRASLATASQFGSDARASTAT